MKSFAPFGSVSTLHSCSLHHKDEFRRKRKRLVSSWSQNWLDSACNSFLSAVFPTKGMHFQSYRNSLGHEHTHFFPGLFPLCLNKKEGFNLLLFRKLPSKSISYTMMLEIKCQGTTKIPNSTKQRKFVVFSET